MSAVAALDENDRLRAGEDLSDPERGTAPMVVRGALPRAVAMVLADKTETDLPSDLHAEASLLGTLLWCGANAPTLVTIGSISDLIASADVFYARANKYVYGAALDLSKEGKPFDAVTVCGALTRAQPEKSVRVMEYLEALLDGAESASTEKARAWAASIADAYARRQMIAAARSIEASARSSKFSAAEVAHRSAALVEKAAKTVVGSADLKPIKVAIRSGFQAAAAPRGQHVPTGIAALDSPTVLGGLFPKNTTILAAATNVGKTVLAVQIARNIVTNDPTLGVLYVSLEMSSTDLSQRLMAADTGVDLWKIRLCALPTDEAAMIAESAKKLSTINIIFADKRDQTAADIDGAVLKAKQQFALAGVRMFMVVIDTAGRVQPNRDWLTRGATQENVLSRVSKWMCGLAEKHECHVMGLHHINREGAKREGKARLPKATDLRDSGSLENDNDNVLLLHRDQDHAGKFMDDVPAALIIGKARNADRGHILLRADMKRGRFLPWDGPPGYYDR